MNKILEYLTTLEQNNNREWYHANKELYKEANKSFEALIYHLMKIKDHAIPQLFLWQNPKL